MVFKGNGSGDSDKLKMYVNGLEKNLTYSGTLPATTCTSTSPFVIGTDYFNGYLDEVKIYPYARTADQVKADYAAGLAGVSTNNGISAGFGTASDKWMSDGLVG
jgi:hypothetical protein